MIKFGKDFARNPILQKSSPAVTPVLPLSSAVLVWFVKNKTERNSSQSKVTIVYSKATSPYQFLNSSNCTISIIALLKGSLKDRILYVAFSFLLILLPSSQLDFSNATQGYLCMLNQKATILVHSSVHASANYSLRSLCTISTILIE